MQNKKKGSNAERELLLMLYNNGYATARVAGSGSTKIPCPDIIAIKDNKGIAIECKTKIGEYLNIKESQIKELETWEKLSKNKAYIAWRLSKSEWYFLHYKEMNKTKQAYSIKKKDIKIKGIIFKDFIK